MKSFDLDVFADTNLDILRDAIELARLEGNDIRVTPDQAEWILARLKTERRMVEARGRKIQAKHALITPACRRIHGHTTAFQKAANEIAGEYFQLVQYEANQEASFHLILEIERRHE